MTGIRKSFYLWVGVASVLACGAIPSVQARNAPVQERDPYLAMNQVLVANGCPLCHGADYARVGPAMTDVAAAYGKVGTAPAQLKDSILNGSKGRWGTAVMPAQHQVGAAEADRIVATILAIRRVASR